jgi:hypothetical protein
MGRMRKRKSIFSAGLFYASIPLEALSLGAYRLYYELRHDE